MVGIVKLEGKCYRVPGFMAIEIVRSRVDDKEYVSGLKAYLEKCELAEPKEAANGNIDIDAAINEGKKYPLLNGTHQIAFAHHSRLSQIP